ncbi:thioesterase family protein [Shewanella sp. 202IG2-18]|uniref:acyl-CoA thioesterase n=1 Tax=Parashewanella hymeniacidonis TaxID=2807618 RepID=UPI001961CFD0|nr:thioesterase family protein [Parashewanella hymeniacidonis]MBM7073004.1 thioesterase family protein [Parashewanella hymeniacidonis]
MNSTTQFSIDLPVRISDVNYGKHLGHAALASLLHQARLKYFQQHNLDELDLDGFKAVVKELNIQYKGQAFFDDILHIAISIDEITCATCKFKYEVTKNSDNNQVTSVSETLVFIDAKSHYPVRTPQPIKQLLNS